MKKTKHAICRVCEKEMEKGKGCTVFHIKLNGNLYPRIPYGLDGWFNGEFYCHDCNVGKGQIHHMGCDVERCPACGLQLISCDCQDEKEE